MSPDDLPRLGVISNPLDGNCFHEYSDLSGKRVLCLGFSEVEVDKYIQPYGPASIILLTHWADHIDARVEKYPLVIGDVTKRTPFDDGSFDIVLTLAVLEHVGSLKDAFAEMSRLVRPGGEMVHMFGPAWSCPYGHHLYLNPTDPNLNFVLWQMPAHMHLLCSRDEIAQYYGTLGYGPELAHAVWHWMHAENYINRCFYDDYVEIMASFQIDRMELMYNPLPKEHLNILRRAYPGRSDFSTYGGRYRLML